MTSPRWHDPVPEPYAITPYSTYSAEVTPLNTPTVPTMQDLEAIPMETVTLSTVNGRRPSNYANIESHDVEDFLSMMSQPGRSVCVFLNGSKFKRI